VCIQETKNPIYMDSNYSFMGEARDKLPSFKGIVLRNVRIFTGGKITLDGYDAAHRLEITFDNVIVDPANRVTAKYAEVTGIGMNFHVSGDDVQVKQSAGKGEANRCEGKFVPFPTAN
jgi:polygalacturonase